MQSLTIEYFRLRRKDGSLGLRTGQRLWRYCVCRQCEHCGRVSSADWVKTWWYRPRGCNDTAPEPTLCLGCFNKIRPLWRVQREAAEIASLSRKLKREAASARKQHENNG